MKIHNHYVQKNVFSHLKECFFVFLTWILCFWGCEPKICITLIHTSKKCNSQAHCEYYVLRCEKFTGFTTCFSFFLYLCTRLRPEGVLESATSRRVFDGKSDIVGVFRRSFLEISVS